MVGVKKKYCWYTKSADFHEDKYVVFSTKTFFFMEEKFLLVEYRTKVFFTGHYAQIHSSTYTDLNAFVKGSYQLKLQLNNNFLGFYCQF